MTSTKRKSFPSLVEFVILVSMMMSLTALSIDAMLPALSQISSDLNLQNANYRQLVVSVLFIGLAFGQLFFGPYSDKVGRKPAIYAGYGLYIAGSIISIFAFNYPMMLFGRLMQGVGISAPRAITLALVRDRYEGRAMAQVMSFIMTIFILVPMIAPLMGQTILHFSGWRSIFGSFVLLAVITLVWFTLRMPETLAPENRAPFSLRRIWRTTLEIIKIRPAVGYTITAGLVSGAHMGYLNSAQQVFQEQYALGELFPLYFALIALSLGVAFLFNARLVMTFGMRSLVRWSLIMVFALSIAALGMVLLTKGQPPLGLLLAYFMFSFFGIGILFGNNNALAMQPLGHIAGIGAAIVGSLSTLIAIPLGVMIGQSYNGTILPLVAGIAILTGLSLVVVNWTEAGVLSVRLGVRKG